MITELFHEKNINFLNHINPKQKHFEIRPKYNFKSRNRKDGHQNILKGSLNPK